MKKWICLTVLDRIYEHLWDWYVSACIEATWAKYVGWRGKVLCSGSSLWEAELQIYLVIPHITRMTETDMEGCQESIENRARDNWASARGLERRMVFYSLKSISNDDNIQKTAFDVNDFSRLLRWSGSLAEMGMSTSQVSAFQLSSLPCSSPSEVHSYRTF